MAEFKAEKEVFKAAIEKYGQKAQTAMFIEEAAELTKEICKNWRGQSNLIITVLTASAWTGGRTMDDRKRCCCNCRRNIRIGKPGKVTCHCEIDGHYISYVACFEGWCRRWARETKWDKDGGQDE